MIRDWRKIDEAHWMSLYWDLYLEYGTWRAWFLYGKRPIPGEFKSPEDAMKAIEAYQGVG